MADFSFDVVSKVDMQEVRNAVDQAQREVGTRYDFKGSNCTIEHDDAEIKLHADSEPRMTALIDVLQSKMIRRGIDITSLDYGKPESGSKDTIRQTVTVKQGMSVLTRRFRRLSSIGSIAILRARMSTRRSSAKFA